MKTGSGQPLEADGSILMSKVTSAEYDRVKTGPWDIALGGGLVKGNTILLGGMPGAGKSTLIQQMTVAYLKAMPVGEGMYIASEEALPALKERGDRLHVDVQDRIRLVDAMTGVADIGAILLSRKPIFIMIDSLNGIVGDDMAMSVELCRVLKKYSTVLQAPCIAVSHFNKDLDFAGLMALQHEVDALVTLDVDEGTGVRILEARKNRTGKTFVPVPFTMTEHGLVLFEEEERDLPA